MTSMSIIYAVTAVVSLLLFVGLNYMIHNVSIWYQLLFTSIFVVNLGYFTLSVSKTLEEALLANRISYLGSVFLPMSMFLLILNVSKIKYMRCLHGILLAISIVVFLIAASPGYSTVYYQEVALSFRNGAAVLDKVYGPLHSIYLFYLLGYFAVMVLTTIYAVFKKKMESNTQAIILLFAVLINIFVWLIEQLIYIEFEFLSISYIITEVFLICLHFMLMEQEKMIVSEPAIQPSIVSSQQDEPLTLEETDPDSYPTETPTLPEERIKEFLDGLLTLTPTERIIYDLYVSKKTTKEIMASLNIKENTLKFHNKNIYGKLGVSSRKQLLETHKQINS